MMTGALALLFAVQPIAAAPGVETAHAWQPSIFSGKKGGWPQRPAPPAIDPATGAPNPVVCRSGGASILTGRSGTKPVCTVETPETMAAEISPTIFSGRLASRQRAAVQQEQAQFVASQRAYAQARAEASGTAYVPPPPTVIKPKPRVTRPSIFTGRRRAPASGQ